MTEKTEKVIVKLPWSKITVLITTLIKSMQGGGITKEEGEKLLELLAEVVVDVAESVAKK